MSRRLRLVVIAALVLAPFGARGRETSFVASMGGNELLNVCDSDVTACLAFVNGVADTMSAVQADGGRVFDWRACMPDGVTRGEIRDVVVNFLWARPELRHLAAVILVVRALGEAFPCR